MASVGGWDTNESGSNDRMVCVHVETGSRGMDGKDR